MNSRKSKAKGTFVWLNPTRTQARKKCESLVVAVDNTVATPINTQPNTMAKTKNTQPMALGAGVACGRAGGWRVRGDEDAH